MSTTTSTKRLEIYSLAQSILTNRSAGKNNISYDFPGHDLTMSLQPHTLPQSSAKAPHVTKVTIQTLTSTNKAFAETITQTIDEMIAQRKSAASESDTNK